MSQIHFILNIHADQFVSGGYLWVYGVGTGKNGRVKKIKRSKRTPSVYMCVYYSSDSKCLCVCITQVIPSVYVCVYYSSDSKLTMSMEVCHEQIMKIPPGTILPYFIG